MVRVHGNGDPLVMQACQRTLAVFDGRMRYDLQLAFKRLERVKAEKGYQGIAVVCSGHFAPIAGHIPDPAAIKYLTELRAIAMWPAPLAGTPVLLPLPRSAP